MSGYVGYRCVECGRERRSSNPKADVAGTTCPCCLLAARDVERARGAAVQPRRARWAS